MIVQTVNDMQTPIGDLLRLAGSAGILLKPHGESPFALVPLDDDLIDFLLERNPRFIEECRRIRENMRHGGSRTQEEVNDLFGRNVP